MSRKKHKLAVRLGLSILALALATAAFAGEPLKTISKPIVTPAEGDPDSPGITPIVTKRLRPMDPWQDGFARTPGGRTWLGARAVWMRVYLGGWLGR
jgi:hypothetical protein